MRVLVLVRYNNVALYHCSQKWNFLPKVELTGLGDALILTVGLFTLTLEVRLV